MPRHYSALKPIPNISTLDIYYMLHFFCSGLHSASCTDANHHIIALYNCGRSVGPNLLFYIICVTMHYTNPSSSLALILQYCCYNIWISLRDWSLDQLINWSNSQSIFTVLSHRRVMVNNSTTIPSIQCHFEEEEFRFWVWSLSRFLPRVFLMRLFFLAVSSGLPTSNRNL